MTDKDNAAASNEPAEQKPDVKAITLDKYFAQFAAVAIPENASDNQRSDMRMAFYVGAHAVMSIQSAMVDSDIGEEEGSARMQQMYENVGVVLREHLGIVEQAVAAKGAGNGAN